MTRRRLHRCRRRASIPRRLRCATPAVALATVVALAGRGALAQSSPGGGASATRPRVAAEADERARARAHFERGVRFAEDGRWPDAIRELQAARDIRPTASVLFNLGVAYRAVDRAREAIGAFEEFLRLARGPSGGDPADLARVRDYLAALRASLVRVTLRVRPADASVLLDGEPLARPAPSPLLLDPGRHVLVAEATGYRAATRALAWTAGSRATVDLALERLPAARGATTPPPWYAHPAFWVVGGLIVAGAVAGGVAAYAVTADHGFSGPLGRVTDLVTVGSP